MIYLKFDDIKQVVVVGAGIMGHSIAQVYAQGGYNVDLMDLKQEHLNYALKMIESNLTTLAEFGRVESSAIPSILNRIHTNVNLESVAINADLVIEAVNEQKETNLGGKL